MADVWLLSPFITSRSHPEWCVHPPPVHACHPGKGRPVAGDCSLLSGRVLRSRDVTLAHPALVAGTHMTQAELPPHLHPIPTPHLSRGREATFYRTFEIVELSRGTAPTRISPPADVINTRVDWRTHLQTIYHTLVRYPDSAPADLLGKVNISNSMDEWKHQTQCLEMISKINLTDITIAIILNDYIRYFCYCLCSTGS